MAPLSWVQRLYWRYLSKPVACRALYSHAMSQKVGSILEIGVGNGERIAALLHFCRDVVKSVPVRYAGLDPFESGGAGRLTLKGAHRLLHEYGVKAHLIPGDPKMGVVRVAHTILPSDLIILDGVWENGSEASAVVSQWLPRLCHANSAIFASQEEGGILTRIDVPVAVQGTSSLQRAA